MIATKQQQLLAQALVQAARAALGAQQPEPAEALREAIGVLWPDCPDLVELQGTVLYLTFRTGEALALLHGRTDTRSLALKGACLNRLQHPDWREPLQEVLMRDDDEGALRFAHKMLAMEGEAVPRPAAEKEVETNTETEAACDMSGKFLHFQGVRA